MPTISCRNNECDKDIEFDISDLDIKQSEPFGSHTTQYSGSKVIKCASCGTENEVSYIWDEENDTGEVMDIDRI